MVQSGPTSSDWNSIFFTQEVAIRVAEQENIIAKQAQVNSNAYLLPPRRQKNGGPETMDLCNARRKSSRVNNYKKLQKCNRHQKTWHYAYECSAPSAVPRTAGNSNLRAAKRGPRRGSTLLRKMQQRIGRPINGPGQ